MTTRINIHTSLEKPLRLTPVNYNGHVWVSIVEENGTMFSLFPPPGTDFEALRVACEAFNAALGQRTEVLPELSQFALGDQQ